MQQDPIAAIQQDLQAGRLKSALKKARINAKKFPRAAAFPILAARALAATGDHRGAAGEFGQALKLDPANTDLRCDFAMALILAGRPDQAERALDGVAGASIPRAHYMRGMIATARGDFRAAVAAADAALSLAPKMTEALNLRGVALTELRRPDDAIADFRQMLALQPGNLRAREALADRLAEAGQLEESREEYRALLAHAPGHGQALYRLAQSAPPEELAALAEAVRTARSAPAQDAGQDALLDMASGTILSRQGDEDAARTHFDRAHASDAGNHPVGTRAKETFDHMMRLFGAPVPLAEPLAGPRPLFVVGLPRSGSTLAEMILTTAPGIASCGELVAAERLYRDLIRPLQNLDPGTVQRFADAYRAALPDLPDGTMGFVDKMPANYAHLGLLLSAFPEARAIDMRRDPRDVAASMWQQRFTSEGMAYASSLRRIGETANAYRRYMARWSDLFPGRILTMHYEDLVRDIEPATLQMAAFCGIEWIPAMLSPESNTAAVRTASLLQVREKVHARSIGRWSILGQGVTELVSALDPALWPEITRGL